MILNSQQHFKANIFTAIVSNSSKQSIKNEKNVTDLGIRGNGAAFSIHGLSDGQASRAGCQVSIFSYFLQENLMFFLFSSCWSQLNNLAMQYLQTFLLFVCFLSFDLYLF